MTEEQKTKRRQPRYENQKNVRLDNTDIEIIRNAFDHYVRRCGINRPDDDGYFSENDWIVKALRTGANRELRRDLRGR